MAEAMPNDALPKKRVQSCQSCKNHGSTVSKTGHRCRYKTCTCILCRLLKLSQKVMCHQQRFWRHQKIKLESEGINGNGNVCDKCKIDNQGLAKKKHQKCLDQNCYCEQCNRRQVCDKCRNHNILVAKKNHKCPKKNCECEYCQLTFKRRKIMKHLQRVKRSGIKSPANPDVIEAEDCFRQNASEFSFISDSSTPEEIEDCDQSDSNPEDEAVELPKRLNSPIPKSFNHFKKQRLLGGSVHRNVSPRLRKSPSPPMEVTVQEMPPLEPLDTNYSSISSPPSLISMNDSTEEPTVVSVNSMATREEFVHNSRSYFSSTPVSIHAPTPTTAYHGLYKPSPSTSSMIHQESLRYPTHTPDISYSSQTLFLQSNAGLSNFLHYSRRQQPINPPYCIPSPFLFDHNMRGQMVTLPPLRHRVDKIHSFLHPDHLYG